MGTLKIYALNNIQIYNIILVTIFTILYIPSLRHIYFITGSLSLLTTFNIFAQPPPLNPYFYDWKYYLSPEIAFIFFKWDFCRHKLEPLVERGWQVEEQGMEGCRSLSPQLPDPELHLTENHCSAFCTNCPFDIDILCFK